nr:immunoglobulin light chain junction region [Macaca mulatta]MOX78326.1 immunoglobulin light chain junction region [Macaca mulatta]MOX78931.1 immunoglobulin light chain junction region [Macaca mulatta]MOX80075.1 immunoglobulin light chain junction region [Macaca mulatta]MOX80826.1 immunoglobulin light chain junction region [Macaca mulatta]
AYYCQVYDSSANVLF